MVRKIHKEDLDGMAEFEVIVPAKTLLDSITVATKATNSKIAMTEKRMKELKLVLGYLNSYIKAFSIKTSYHKLVGIDTKIRAFKDIQKKKNKKGSR